MYIYILYCVMVHFVVGENIRPRTDLPDDTNDYVKRDFARIKPLGKTNHLSSPYLDGTRLIGGSNVSIHSFPYQAATYRYTPRFKGFSGGAIILSARYLLTAAHCVGGRTDEYSVVIGHSRVPNHFDSNFLYGKSYKLKDIRIHPEYDASQFPTNADNDIAVLTVDGELKLNGVTSKAIQLSVMPTPPGIMAVVSGYGNMTRIANPGLLDIEVEEFHRHLRAAPIPTVEHESCLKYFDEFDSFYHVTENMICAGRPCNNDDCEVKAPPNHGDSGGALVSDNKLIGIVAFGWGCRSYDPGVYTYVYRHKGFIRVSTNSTLDV